MRFKIRVIVMALLVSFYVVVIPDIRAATHASPYITDGDCDGFPKVKLTVRPGMCVGLVASQLGFVRGVAAIGSDLYLADMGDWSKGRGRLLRLSDHGRGVPEIVLDHLDEPSAILPAPNKTLYLSVLGKIIRYNPATRKSTDVIINLPATGKHPIAAMAAAMDGSLFINIGSSTDHCERDNGNPPDPNQSCPETIEQPFPRGSLLHIMPRETAFDAKTVSAYAVGLRNTAALTVSPAGKLYAATNARDAISDADPTLSDDALPHDTFNIVVQGKDYGWPYCYDNNVPSPEYPHYDCSTKQLPMLLLPAHSASLGMIFYKGSTLPGLKNRLILSYHGYRKTGHRIVAVALDKSGQPKPTIDDIVTGWELMPGDHPQGAPVGLFELEDGSILIAEDHNHTLLRLAPEQMKHH